VAEQGVSLHSVTHRVKGEASLAKKLSGPGHSYQALTDVTDLAGVRVTTYFHDHVDLVASAVEREFAVDQKNSVDKRRLLDPDRYRFNVGRGDERNALSDKIFATAAKAGIIETAV
jgi:ppGpp synthetase/RelA/SpoT-type nucleotidyltranferase